MEAKIARETADGLQRLGQVRQGSIGDIDAEADALSRLNGERERELDNIVKRDNMGHETRTAGTSTGTRQGIIEWLKGAGLDEALAEYVSKDFVDANGNVAYMDNGGQKKWRGNSMDHALSNVVDYYKFGQGKEEAEAMAAEAAKQKAAKEAKTAAKPTPAASPSPAAAPASSGGSGATYVSNISINGQTKTVKFADASSQATTEQLLRDLAGGKGVY